MVALMVVLTIITFLTIDYWVQRAERKAAHVTAPQTTPGAARALSAPSIALGPPIDRIPAEAFLFCGHTWAKIEPGGTIRIGTDRFAPALLGAPDSVAIATAGSKVKQGEVFAHFRRAGREIHLRAPVGGVIEAVNPRLARDPGQVARDPFVLGWLVRVRADQLGANLRSLLIGDEAASWLRAELSGLRERLGALVPAPLGTSAAATLFDGGPPAEGVASHLTHEQWLKVAERVFEPAATTDQ